MKIKIASIVAVFLKLVFLQAETVEIVSDMYTEEILNEVCFEQIKDYELRITDQKYKIPVTTDYEAVKRYLIFNAPEALKDLDSCPSEKKVLFMMEPMRIFPKEAFTYSRVYTWDDDMIDNEKYFKYYFPDLMPMVEDDLSFEDKKLCTMIVRNWNAEHRKPIVEFFSAVGKGEFEFYGSPFPNLLFSKCYKGRIAGLNCGVEKIKTLQNYRFCFCIENTVGLNGYISEKIFPCFAAGCVPIYWGAPNIEKYIPRECYIDYRDFKSLEELYAYMKTMPENVYIDYVDNIRTFLNSDQAQLFSPQNFAQTLYEAVVQ